MAEPYKLTYFNMRGLGEPIRLIFALAEVPYEDHRIERDQWPQHKEILCQSKAICRYLANKYNLGGEDYWEAAKMDEISDAIADFQAEIGIFFLEQDEVKKAQLVKEFDESTAPKYLNQFQTQLKNNGGLYLVGKKICWVDLQLVHLLDMFESLLPGYLEKYPGLIAFKQAIFKIPQIKTWLDKRPSTQF